MVPPGRVRDPNERSRAEGEKRLSHARKACLAATALDTTAKTDRSVSRCAVLEQVYISNSAAISRKDEPFDASPVMGLTLHMSGSAGSVQP